jgi:hypothetical protein
VDGGVLSDASEIAYYKQTQANDVLNNLLLGDFNQNGNYIIKKEVLVELLKITKVLQHTYGKTLFCISLKDIKTYGNLEFAVKVERKEGGKAVASLELLEAINKIGGYYQNINTVLLATYTDIYDMDFIKKVYQAFNIISKEDEFKGRKKLENETIDEILARKDYLSALLKISELNLSDTERKFYEARIAALSKSGDYGKAVLVRMQLEANKISKLFLKPNTPQYFQKMNQLLDKVLEDMKKSLDKGLIEKLNQAEQAYIQATQADRIRANDELFRTKTLPENLVLAQLNQQKKAETQKEVFAPKLTNDYLKEVSQTKETTTKISSSNVEIVKNERKQNIYNKPNEVEVDDINAFGNDKTNAQASETVVNVNKNEGKTKETIIDTKEEGKIVEKPENNPLIKQEPIVRPDRSSAGATEVDFKDFLK